MRLMGDDNVDGKGDGHDDGNGDVYDGSGVLSQQPCPVAVMACSVEIWRRQHTTMVTDR